MAKAPLVLALVLAIPLAAAAQAPFEVVGSRALGMAGAFVAVADDATAAYWNPAGLATGTPVGATIEWARFQNGNQTGPLTAGLGRRASTFSSLGSWPLALSFGRAAATTTVDSPSGTLSARRQSWSQYGVTILQTLVPGLVVGSTLKYVRGDVTSTPVSGLSVAEAFDAAGRAEGRARGAFDLDVGLMADLERVRVGIVWKNLRRPVVGEIEGTSIRVPRLARFGLAVLPAAGVTLAMDVDLDTVDLRDGLRRMIALGGEGPAGSRVAWRGGVRWHLEGDRAPLVAVGASWLLRTHVWVDGHFTHGRSGADRGFGFALRAGY
jgi:hypothetical protein